MKAVSQEQDKEYQFLMIRKLIILVVLPAILFSQQLLAAVSTTASATPTNGSSPLLVNFTGTVNDCVTLAAPPSEVEVGKGKDAEDIVTFPISNIGSTVLEIWKLELQASSSNRLLSATFGGRAPDAVVPPFGSSATLEILYFDTDGNPTSLPVVNPLSIAPGATVNLVVSYESPFLAGSKTLTVTLFDTTGTSIGSTSTESTTTTYEWDFGDGSPVDSNSSTSHIYTVDGSYTATFTSTCNAETASSSVTITVGSLVAGYSVSHDGSASTCFREAVTFTAIDSGGNPVTDYTGLVNISTSTSHGDWFTVDDVGGSTDPAQGPLANGISDDGSATYQFDSLDQGTVTLYLSNTHADDLTITVSESGGTLTSTSGNLVFGGNAFLFTVTDTLGMVPVAGRDHQIKVEMVRQNPGTGTCAVESGYNGNKNLKAWITRDAADPGGTGPSIGASGNLPNAVPAGNNLALNFTLGAATFNLTTTDVGKYILNFRDDTQGFANSNIDGSTGALVVRPFGFDIDSGGKRAADYGDNGLLDDSIGTNNSWAADANGTVFVKAGENFNATVRAVRWQNADDVNNDGIPDTGANLTDNNKTQSFGLETPAELVTVTHSVTLPTVPGDTGTLTGGNNLALGAGAGEITTVLSWDEAGIIDLIAATDGNYLGSGVNVSNSTPKFGRFYPDRFIVADNSPNFANACTLGATPFTYLGQTFFFNTAPALTITALNIAGAVTENYGDTSPASAGGVERFWKLSSTLTRTYTDQSGHAAAYAEVQDPTILLSGDLDFDGQAVVALENSDAGDAFGYMRVDGVTPEAPFTADVDVLFDAATLTDSDNVCYDPDDNDVCDDYIITGLTGSELRFGRLVIGIAAGSELLPISVPLQTEYFDGTGFVVNTDDACSLLANNDLSLTSAVQGPELDGDVDISNDVQCSTTGVTTATIANSPFINGDAGLSFTAPGNGCAGYADITLDLSSISLTIGPITYPDLTFLRYDWQDADGNGDGPYDQDPVGRVDFGIYTGSSEYIYIREPW